MKTLFKLVLGVLLLLAFQASADPAIIMAGSTPFVDLAGGCQKILRQMGDLTKQNYPFLLGRKTGMIDFLLNPINGSIKLDLNNVQEGKKYIKSKVVYKVRTKPSEILEDTNIQDICNYGSEPSENSVDVVIQKRIASPPKAFTNAKMINICQDTDAFIREYMMSDMRALREKADEYLLSQADSYKGRIVHQAGGETSPGKSKTCKLLGTDTTTGTQVPLFATFSDILLDYQKMEFGGYPHIIGEGIMQKFMSLSKFSCCNADGVAYDSAVASSGSAFYLDQAANRILGDNDVLVVAPNVIHLLWFNKNNNINIDSKLVAHIVIPDPVYPQLKWDLDFKWDECNEKWVYRLSTYLDLFVAPQSDSFGTDNSPSTSTEDELAGVNGIWGYTATQG